MMSEIMSALCEHAKVTKLVDVGSGKAYLSQVLAAMRQNLQILAIDSQSGNLQGAQKRSANLEVTSLYTQYYTYTVNFSIEDWNNNENSDFYLVKTGKNSNTRV